MRQQLPTNPRGSSGRVYAMQPRGSHQAQRLSTLESKFHIYQNGLTKILNYSRLLSNRLPYWRYDNSTEIYVRSSVESLVLGKQTVISLLLIPFP